MTDLALVTGSDETVYPAQWFQRLSGMFLEPTRPPWQDGLQRPGTVTYQNAVFAGQDAVSRYWTPRNRYLDTLWSYYVGDPPLPQIEPEYHDVFRSVLRKARSNYAPMCVAAMLDRLELQAVSTLKDSDTDGDDLAAEIMDETGFNAVSKDLFAYSFGMGESYGMVVPGGPGDPVLSNGKPAPSIHAIDPRRCIGVPDWRNPVRLAAALVRQYDPITMKHTAFLFLPGWKWTLRWNQGTAKWDLSNQPPEKVEGLDELGGIPIVRFENLNGMGEYEPHLDVLDRIIDTTLQRIIGFWYQALRQRALRGDDEEDEDEDTPESAAAEPVDLNKLFRAGPGALWRIPKEFEIWESQQTDFGPLLNGKRDDVQEFAAVSSTPLHLISPDAAKGSAEGAGLLRESLTAKVRDRRARFTPPLKLLWRMAFAFAGEADRGKRMRLHWGPIEFRTLAEQASASSQSIGTLSNEDRCERIWQMPPEETARNMQRLTAEKLLELSTPAPNQNQQPVGPAAAPAVPAAANDDRAQ
ncbi:phage portal protein [Mycobacterium asiaticum]|uniref:phage portal protein n=1 Tax=Mycobacterium asiaticum TaxID=1790 RepID=UPI001E2D7BDB|nr:phage portal protein [Mycobacterium asiaticum]